MSDLVKHGVAVGDIWDFQAGQDDLWRVDAVDHVTATATLSGCSSKTMGRGCSGFATEHFDRATLRMRPETVTTNVASEAKSVDPLAEYNQHNEASYCVCFSCDKLRVEAMLAKTNKCMHCLVSGAHDGAPCPYVGVVQKLDEQMYSQYARVTPRQGAAAWTQYAAQPEPAKPLPFKRHPKCDLWHDTHPNSGGCLSCEHLIGDEMAMLDEKTKPAAKPIAREPYEPLHGAFVGRVLTPVGR